MIKKFKFLVSDFLHKYKTEKSTSDKMSTREIASFGITNFGNGTQGTIISSYSKYFLMMALGVDPITVGVIFATITIIEGIRNPLVGIIVDCTRTKWGRFRPYVIIGFPLASLLSILFFVNPFSGSEPGVTVWTYITYILWTTVCCFSNVAWDGLQKCLSKNGEEKRLFFSIGQACSSISGVLPGIVPVVIDLANHFHLSLRLIFICFGTLFGLIGFLATTQVRFLRERIIVPRRENPFTNIRAVFKNKYVVLFWFGNLTGILGNLSGGVTTYLYLYCFGAYTWQTLMWGVAGLGAWLTLFFSKNLFKRIPPKVIIILNMVFLGMGYLTLYFFGYASILPFFIISLFTHPFEYVAGVSQSIINTDIMDYNEWKLGIRNEATIGTVGGIIGTIFGAINSVLLGVVLAKIGLKTGEGAVQSLATKDSIFMLYTIFGGISTLLNIIPWLIYDLNPKRMVVIRKELEERRRIHIQEEKIRKIPIYF